MAYDGEVFYGDLMAEEYDDENNFINPPSPTGFFIYYLFYAFDKMQEISAKFRTDFSILSADTRSLDRFWGVSYNLPRPSLPSGRILTDEEYRIYLYLLNTQLITKEDILIAISKAFDINQSDIIFMTDTYYLSTTDHLNYDSYESEASNLQKQADDTTNDYIIDYKHSNDSDVKKLGGKLSKNPNQFQIITIPQQNMDKEFLEYLTPYLTVKGNIKIVERII